MLRRAAVLQIFDRDFRPILSGRLGRHQLAGEDAELCLATRLLGWGFLYSRDLVIGHAIEPARMNLGVLRKTAVGFGLSSVALEVYRAQFDPPFKRWVKTTDVPFVVYSLVKMGMRSLNSLLRKNMRARTALWMSQGAAVGLLSGMRPSRVLASPFLARTIAQRRQPVEEPVR
jgi:hypothetical protein